MNPTKHPSQKELDAIRAEKENEIFLKVFGKDTIYLMFAFLGILSIVITVGIISYAIWFIKNML